MRIGICVVHNYVYLVAIKHLLLSTDSSTTQPLNHYRLYLDHWINCCLKSSTTLKTEDHNAIKFLLKVLLINTKLKKGKHTNITLLTFPAKVI